MEGNLGGLAGTGGATGQALAGTGGELGGNWGETGGNWWELAGTGQAPARMNRNWRGTGGMEAGRHICCYLRG